MCVRIVDPEQVRAKSERVYQDSDTGFLYLLTLDGGKWKTIGFKYMASVWGTGETPAEAFEGLEPVEIGTLLEVVE